MLFDIGLDVLEGDILEYSPKLLALLLKDKTTGRNILWATDDYSSNGDDYKADCEIQVSQITGEHTTLIRPRVAKSLEEQENRTKNKAEVFTPCWVCNSQNNLIDAQWFGRKDVFNIENENQWAITTEKISFPETGPKTWKKYVDTKRLEITCGEAPYLASRYDTVTGKLIPVAERIGLLDRKLRVVNENTDDEESWIKWTLRAFQSVYGYEFQGDSLLLARENLLATFIEYYQSRFGANPSLKQLMNVVNVISWNIWQMDGMKCVVPNSCKSSIYEESTLFGSVFHEIPCPGCEKGLIHKHTGTYCKIFDWRENASFPFVTMMKGAQS